MAEVHYRRTPLELMPDRPLDFPGSAPGKAITPAEAIIEGEPQDWWTLGRRIRIGLAAAETVNDLLPGLPVDELRLPALPAPYDLFSGGYDGLALYQKRHDLGLPAALFAEVPTAARGDHWNPSEMFYDGGFPCGDTQLMVEKHDGGDVDWWSLEAQGPLNTPAESGKIEIEPARFRYPGAPLPRWWQIENAKVDIGGFPPDRSHFPTMLLLDLLLSHSDDWFTLPIRPENGRIGDAIAINEIVIKDVFGDRFTIHLHEKELRITDPIGKVTKYLFDWSLFQVRGLEATALAVVPTAATPLAGDVIEQVALGIDEDANLLLAVEERANGRHLTTLSPEPAPDPVQKPDMGERQGYLFRPSTPVPNHWHPYLLDEASGGSFFQGRLADYTRLQQQEGPPEHEGDWLAPEPQARLLYDDQAQGGSVHQIEPAAVPVQGLRLDRRFVLARRTGGSPILWIQRLRQPLLSPPASGLRFDLIKDL